MTPLWRLSYEEQLSLKSRRLRGVLQRIEDGIGGLGGGKGGGGKKSPTAAAASIDFLGILRSPTTDGYRNKCEFTVGLGVAPSSSEEGKEGKKEGEEEANRDGEAECGFCLGAYRDGIVEVGGVSGCRNVSRVAKGCASAFSQFMRGESRLKPWDKRHNSGFWRLLIVREGRRETVLPLPSSSFSPAPEGGEEAASLPSPPPPFVSLDWRPWLVSSADLELQAAAKEETKEGAAKAKVAGQEAAAAPAAAAGAARPSPSSPFEALPADEILLVVQVDPTAPGAKGDAALVKRELVTLGKALRAAVAGCRRSSSSSSSLPSGSSPPTRLVLQHHSGLSNSAPDDAPLLPWPEEEVEGEGKEEREEGERKRDDGFITDALCGLRFRVSPSSFFQVNSGAAALLYRLALDWAGLKQKKEEKEKIEEGAEKEAEGGEKQRSADEEPETAEDEIDDDGSVFLDVCCGTGTIGICAAAAGAHRVVGVDVVEAAIRDAEANAIANGLSVFSSSSSTLPSSSSSKAAPSCRFVAAKAEDVMASLLAEEEAAGKDRKSRFVAVVDPPRAGLHAKVRSALRGCAAVSRIVYVSCNPDTLASDCISLCTRGGNGRAFRPVRAVAADLFPMTSHCEAVVLLER